MPQHLSKLVNKNTILNLNIASYFLNILASPDVSTWSSTCGAIKKTIEHLRLTRNHQHKVEITWNLVNKCKEMDQEYTGNYNVTRNFNPSYLVSNLDELNILWKRDLASGTQPRSSIVIATVTVLMQCVSPLLI